MEPQSFVDKDFLGEEGSGDEVNDEEHGKLLRVMHVMDNQQRIKPPSRTEPSIDISEFHLPKFPDVGVHLKDLARSLDVQGKAFSVDIANKIKALNKKNKVLSKPLEKVEEQKVKRVVAYKNLTKHVGRWEAIVETNRAARSVTFPLDIDPLHAPNSTDLIANWQTQPPSELEEGINKLLGLSQTAQVDRKEEEELRLTLAELREKRREMAKLRVQQSYEAAKAKRMKKIKSKQYHRILRRAKLHKELQEFAALQKTDPEAALRQMEKMEAIRAQERMTLRHKSSGHWARSRLAKAKYNPQTRAQLAEQLATSRDLTKKLKAVDSDEDDDGDNKAAEELAKTKMFTGDEDKDNPWITVKPGSEVEEFVSGYRRYWDKVNQLNGKELQSVPEKQAIPAQGSSVERLSNANVVEEIGNSGDKSVNGLQPTEGSVRSEDQKTDFCEVSAGSSSVKQRLSTKRVGNSQPEDLTSCEPEERLEGDARSVPWSASSGTKTAKQCKLAKRSPEASKRKRLLHMSAWEVTPLRKLKTVSSPCGRTDAEKEAIDNGGSNETPKTVSEAERFLNSIKESVFNAKTDSKKKKKKKNALDKMFKEVENNISEKLQEKIGKLSAIIQSDDLMGGTEEKKKSEEDMGPSLAMPNMRELRPREDKELYEGSLPETAHSNIPVESFRGGGGAAMGKGSDPKSKEANINPDNFIVAKPKILLSAAPDIVTAGEEALDEDDEKMQQTIVTEAFADDDIVDSFRKEKEDEEKRGKLEDLDLSLPGWGSWGGTGIVQSKRKKRRFIAKAPSAPPRKDANKLNVIINEEVEKSLRNHQVCELPAPFTSVKDFETSIRAPIGSTWVPQTAHEKIIKPAVILKMGKIIKPMDEEFLVNKKVMINK